MKWVAETWLWTDDVVIVEGFWRVEVTCYGVVAVENGFREVVRHGVVTLERRPLDWRESFDFDFDFDLAPGAGDLDDDFFGDLTFYSFNILVILVLDP